MPRNSSGSYVLPSGNPVVTQTVISSTWANTTLNDMASELTNSLDRNGRGPMLAPLPLANGTATLPALTFGSETASGFFRNASNDLRMQVNTVTIEQWVVTGAVFPLGLTATQSQTNTPAIVATGNGTAAGITATGGSSNGAGISGTGGGTSGTGGTFQGAATNGPGLIATGGGTGPGATLNPGSTNIAATVNAFLDFRTAPTGNAGVDRQQGPSNLLRASARCSYNGNTDPVFLAGFNISAVKNTGAGSFYIELLFDMGTACIVVFSDYNTTGNVKKRTLEILSQTIVGGKTRIPFQVVDTTTGGVVAPDLVASAGFNVHITAT